MFWEKIRLLLATKYGIDITQYDIKTQLEIIKQIIARNDKVIDIYAQKQELLSEIIKNISDYLTGGGKVATKWLFAKPIF